MKTKDYKTAKRLAEITGKPIEEYYDGTLHEGRPPEDSQEEVLRDTSETGNSPGRPLQKSVPRCVPDTTETSEDIRAYLETFGGEIRGGRLLRGRQMTRKEFLKAKKELKSVEDFWNSPLIYLMFRSEGQIMASFIEWANKMEKELE